jgi:hypothetical protein
MAAILVLVLAHESTVSSSRLELREREIRATFTFSLEDLAGLARLDLDRNGVVEPAEWARVLPGLAAYVGDKFRIESGGVPLRSEAIRDVLPPALPLAQGRAPVELRLRYVASGAIDRVTLCCRLFAEHGGNPRHVAELGGRTFVFDRDRPEVGGVSGWAAERVRFSTPPIAMLAALLPGAVVTGRFLARRLRLRSSRRAICP